MACVGKCTQTTDDNTSPVMFSDDNAPGPTLFFDWQVTSPAPGALSLYANGTVQRTGSFVPDGAWHLFLAIFDGASSAVYVDNVLAISGNPGAAGLAGLRIGNWNWDTTGGGGFEGDIAEVGGWSKAFDSTDRADIYAYYLGYYFAKPRSFGVVMG